MAGKSPQRFNKGFSQQHERFLEAAREHGADVDEGAADRLMGKLAKMPPEPKPAPKARANTASKK